MATRIRLASEQEIIAYVEKQVGRPFAPGYWNYFMEEGFFEEILDGAKPDTLVQAVKAQVRQALLMDLQSLGKPQLPKQINVTNYRVLLISHVVAKIASTLSKVGQFRSQCLPEGSLLAPKDVREWVHLHTDELLVQWMVLIVDLDVQAVMKQEHDERLEADASRILKAIEVEEAQNAELKVKGIERDVRVTPIRMLDWPAIGQLSADREQSPVLQRLLETAEELSRRFGWRIHQALWFLLTGETPLMPMLLYDISVPRGPGGRVRITIDADVETLPETVESLYRDLRKQLFNEKKKQRSHKRLALALFVDSTPDLKWTERMERWNTSCRANGRSEWFYKDYRIMARDYSTRTMKHFKTQYNLEALQRLIGPSAQISEG